MKNTGNKAGRFRWFWRILIGLLGVMILAGGAFVVWANTTNPVMTTALEALQSDKVIQVTQEPWIIFEPKAMNTKTGIVFYPGGKVDPRSYAPIMRSLAEEGYLTIIVPMPINLAFTGINKVDEVISAYPTIENWIISGHSLGGAMAANYVFNNPGQLQGLILYASYPADNNSLASTNIPVLSIYGTEDGGIDKLTTSPRLLPDNAEIIILKGGNHAQFGDYGLQNGDGEAKISRGEQQTKVTKTTLEWLTFLQSQ